MMKKYVSVFYVKISWNFTAKCDHFNETIVMRSRTMCKKAGVFTNELSAEKHKFVNNTLRGKFKQRTHA